MAAVLALAVGTLLRRSAGAVTAVIAGIVLPYLLAMLTGVLPTGAEEWLVRVTPAAAFAIQQNTPQYAQVSASYTPANGYFPLAPWAGFAVLCAWAAARPDPGHVRAAAEGRVSHVADAQLTRALHAEWTKLRTVAGPGALLLAAIALTAAVGAIAANAVTCPGGGCQVDPARVSLTGIYLGQAVVAIVAVTAVSGEYSTGMMRLTLTATPRRWRVLAAKAAVVGTATLVTGAVAVLASVLAGRLLLARHGIDPAHGYEALSLGGRGGAARRRRLGALPDADRAARPRRRRHDPRLRGGHRDRARPAVPVPDRGRRRRQPSWHRHLDQISPMTAGLYIQATTNLRALPLTPWQGLGVLAAWAAGALLAGGLLLRLRDA